MKVNHGNQVQRNPGAELIDAGDSLCLADNRFYSNEEEKIEVDKA